MDSFFSHFSNKSVLALFIAFIVFLVLYWTVLLVLRKLGKDPKYMLPKDVMKKLALPIFFIFVSIVIRMESLRTVLGLGNEAYLFKKASTLFFIFSMTWFILVVLKVIKRIVINNYNINEVNNIRARKVYTQFNILERIIIFIVIIFAIGLALMTFDEIREIGISVFASAGVAGIIIGFSAQKLIGTILAGIQIAIAQPIKIDDVVIV